MRPALRRGLGSRGFLSAGTAVVLLVSSIAVMAGTGFKFGETKLRDGVTWIFNREDGEVARVNGSSGKVDLKIALPGSKGKDLEIVQRDNAVLVVDPKTGEVASLDVNGLEVAARTDFGTDDDLDVVLGDDAAYVVDRVAGTVQRIDPEDLQRIGAPVRAGEKLSEGVADNAGRLWIARNATGEIIRLDPDGSAGLKEAVRRELTEPGARLEITLVDDGIVVTDAKSGKQWRLDADGNDIGSYEIKVPDTPAPPTPPTPPPTQSPADVAYEVPRITPPVSSGPFVPVVGSDDSGQPTIVIPPTQPGGGGPVQEPIPIEVPSEEIAEFELSGPGVTLGERIYLPVAAEGVLIVLDLQGLYLETISVPGEGEFDLILDDGHLWVNDPDDTMALRIDSDGTVTEVEKATEEVPSTPPTTTIPEEPEDPEAPEVPETPPPPDPGGGDPGETTTTAPPGVSTTIPVTTIPGATTVPETTIPGATTIPVTTIPGATTVPETTVPETTVPGATTVPVPVPTTVPEPPPATTVPGPTTTVPVPKPPGQVTSLLARPGDGTLTLTWGAAPDGGAPVETHRIMSQPRGQCGQLGRTEATELGTTLTGMANGCTYDVTVIAVNSAGAGPPTAVQGTPSSNVPGTPNRPSASVNPNNGTTTVQWEQPDLKGLPISGYVLRATSNNGQHSWQQQLPGDQNQMRIPGADRDQNGSLTYNRSYTFEVKAQTAAEGAFSAPSDLVAPYTGPAGIRITNKVRTGPQQWQYTVEATWRGRVGNIRAAGTAQGDKPGDGARTFDATVNWRGQGTASFQACLDGACTQAAQDSQSNPLPNVGNPQPTWGNCVLNPDAGNGVAANDEVFETAYWTAPVDPGAQGSAQYVTDVQYEWMYAYGTNQPAPTEFNHSFANGTQGSGQFDGGSVVIPSRRHEDAYTFFVGMRFHVQGYDGWIQSGTTMNSPNCPGDD